MNLFFYHGMLQVDTPKLKITSRDCFEEEQKRFLKNTAYRR
jgi:hypothetical protein